MSGIESNALDLLDVSAGPPVVEEVYSVRLKLPVNTIQVRL